MLPELFCEKLKALLGEEYEAFLGALDRPRAVGLRLNPLKTSLHDRSGDWQRQSLSATVKLQLSTFNLSPVPWCETGYYYDPETRPGLHPYHDAGLYYLQEPSAMAPVALLDPRPGEKVLDLCAAPGGKTTQIAGRMENRGLLVCNEIHPKRAAVLASNVERLGVSNALVLNEHPARLAERFVGYFDRILVDAPCSGEGMFRKHDAAFTDWSPETVEMCARRQAEILDSAAGMLRPGGRLVYSTCTFSPEENEGTIEAFLRRHPEYELEPPALPYFAPGRPDWTPGGREALNLCCRLWPHKLRGEGHFAAVLHRTDGDAEAPDSEASVKIPQAAAELLRNLNVLLPEGQAMTWGDRVWFTPRGLPLLRGLKVLRPGLELAQLRGDRAEPAHALALWLHDAASVEDLSSEDPLVAAYLNGQTIPTGAAGWTLVRVDGLSLGWGKGVGGVLKNHYPKGLRTRK